MAHHWLKELLIWHCTVLSLGQMAQLIMIILSLTVLTLFKLIGSRCIPNGTHTGHYWANLAHSSKLIKNYGHKVNTRLSCSTIMKQRIKIWRHKTNGNDNYMKMVMYRDCWSFQTKVMNIFLRSRVNVNDL